MNDEKNTLIRRTSIMADESLPSLLRRLADLNCYDPYSTLIQLIKERSNSKDKVEFPRMAVTYREIAALALIPILEIHTSSAHCFAEVLTPPDSPIDCLNIDEQAFPILSRAYAVKQLRPLHASQFCPKCLKDSAHHRLIWTPIAVSACLQHYCHLISRCPGCQSNVTIKNIVDTRCSKCGVDLSLAESATLYDDEWGMLSQRLIQAWLMQETLPNSTVNLLPSETPRVLYRLVDGLQWATRMLAKTNCLYLHTARSNHPNTKRHQSSEVRNITPHESYSLYATACKGIINWPQGLWDFLRAYRTHMGIIKPADGGPKADLGNFYSQWIQEYWQHPAFEFVHAAFKDFFVRTYSLSSAVIRTSLYQRNTVIAEEISLVNISEAARLLGATPKTVAAMLQAGKIGYQEKITDKRIYRFLNREEILALRDEWDKEVSCAEAAEYLGVTEKMALDLVEVGLLPVERSPAERFPCWAFNKLSLVKCVEQILKHVETCSIEDKMTASFVDLIAASRLLSTVGMNAASIVARVAEGKLRAFHLEDEEPQLRSLLFDRTDIQQCISTVKSEKGWMSREELVKLLGVKGSTLARWIHRGLIPIAEKCGNAQYFDQETVRRFAANHITTDEAAKLLGIGKLAVQKWAREGRLSQVCVSGPHIDGYHAYLFNKGQLIQWRKERLTFGEAVQLLQISKATLHQWVIEGKIRPLGDMGGKQRWFLHQEVELLLDQL